MLLMKQTASIISTYSADVFGVCSALYELGGMTVMHDASGCNSTYNTHDEPRWYDIDSMVYITGLSEMEAVMGDDSKIIDDIVSAAEELSPKFIAIAGTPIPMMIGTDFKAIASVIEKRTGIPSFGFATNGMHDYISGISMAFEAIADRMTIRGIAKTHGLSANIIGFTPLDFSTNGYNKSITQNVRSAGFEVISTWAMDSDLDAIAKSGSACVNLVVSGAGLRAARKLREIYGTPYVIGLPIGNKLSEEIISAMKLSAGDGKPRNVLAQFDNRHGNVAVIGESIAAQSLAAAIKLECGIEAAAICTTDSDREIDALYAEDEDELVELLTGKKVIIADPLYRPICPSGAKFIQLPHEAFSGRIFRNQIPDLIRNFETIKKEVENL